MEDSNKIGILADFFILSGFASLGAGLFFWFGSGVSLTVLGAILLAMGIYGHAK